MPPPLTSADVLSPRDQATIAAATYAALPAELPWQSWSPTALERALVEVDADTLALYEAQRKDIFDGGYITTAKGAYLDLAATFYAETRAPARPAVIQVRLTDSTGNGPYTLPPGQILAYQADPTAPVLNYRSTKSIDVPKGGSADIYFAATAEGSAWNITPGALVSLLSRPPGVAVSTPPVPGTGSIVVIAGADEEGDDSLRARCLLKLSLQGRGWAADTIRGLILDRFAGEVTRVLVLDPWIPNIAAAWLAGPTGPVSPMVAKAAYDYLRQRQLKPVGAMPVQVYPAVLQTIAVKVQLYTHGAVPGIVAAATARLAAFQATLDIGDGVTEILYSQITDALDATPGVLGSDVLDAVTGVRIDNFVPPLKAAPVFTVTWLPIKVV
jgi:uncharacterized phage protein gp47/JayE